MMGTRFIADLQDDLQPLRAAAVAAQHYVHVLDMDAVSPVCHVLPPFQSNFKVKGVFSKDNGSSKKLSVDSSAWSPILGKDVLPRQLLLSNVYGRFKLAVLLKSNQLWHSSVPQAGQHQLPASQLKSMAVSFVSITYEEGRQKAEQPATAKKKRGRPGKSCPVFVAKQALNTHGLA